MYLKDLLKDSLNDFHKDLARAKSDTEFENPFEKSYRGIDLTKEIPPEIVNKFLSWKLINDTGLHHYRTSTAWLGLLQDWLDNGLDLRLKKDNEDLIVFILPVDRPIGILRNYYFELPGIIWIPPNNKKEPYLILKNVLYKDEAGIKIKGELRYHYNEVESRFECESHIDTIPFARQYFDFYKLFSTNGWDWEEKFTIDARTYIDHLTPNEKSNLINAFSFCKLMDDSRIQSIFEDLCHGLNHAIPKDEAFTIIRLHLENGKIDIALQEAIKAYSEIAFIQMRGELKEITTNINFSFAGQKISRLNSLSSSFIDQLFKLNSIIEKYRAEKPSKKWAHILLKKTLQKEENTLVKLFNEILSDINISLDLYMSTLKIKPCYHAIKEWNDSGILSKDAYLVEINKIRVKLIQNICHARGLVFQKIESDQDINKIIKCLEANELEIAIQSALDCFNLSEYYPTILSLAGRFYDNELDYQLAQITQVEYQSQKSTMLYAFKQFLARFD